MFIAIVHFSFSVRGAESFMKILIMKNMIWNKKDQFTLKWNDSKVNVHWPIDNPILSKRDK